jgi:hypothetical protein
MLKLELNTPLIPFNVPDSDNSFVLPVKVAIVAPFPFAIIRFLN